MKIDHETAAPARRMLAANSPSEAGSSAARASRARVTSASAASRSAAATRAPVDSMTAESASRPAPARSTEALLSALEKGELGGAALDVLEGEEGVFYADCRGRLGESSLLARLQALPNALISPHTAYYTEHALRDTVENSLVNCLTFESRYQHVHG